MTRLGLAWLAIAAVACGGSGSSSDGGGSETGDASSGDGAGSTMPAADDTTGGAMMWPPGETAGLGEPCTWHDECVTWYCRRFADAPPDPEAACADTPPFGSVVITGTVRDLRTREVVPSVPLRVISAFAGVADPVGADALAETMADASGRFETTSDLVNGTPIGIVATIEAAGYYLTATALAGVIDESNNYYPGNDIHDMWVVPEADVTAFSEMLASDPLIEPYLPLGEKGGSIGFVRDPATGEPVAGVVVQSQDGLDSAAYVRYLNEAEDGFNADATGSSGIFVIVNPDLAEEFEGFLGEESVGSNVAGSAEGSVLAITIQ